MRAQFEFPKEREAFLWHITSNTVQCTVICAQNNDIVKVSYIVLLPHSSTCTFKSYAASNLIFHLGVLIHCLENQKYQDEMRTFMYQSSGVTLVRRGNMRQLSLVSCAKRPPGCLDLLVFKKCKIVRGKTQNIINN